MPTIDNGFCKCPRIQSLVWKLCSKSDFYLGSGGKNDQSGTTLHYGRGNTHWRHCVGWAGASWESRMLNCLYNGHLAPATHDITESEQESGTDKDPERLQAHRNRVNWWSTTDMHHPCDHENVNNPVQLLQHRANSKIPMKHAASMRSTLGGDTVRLYSWLSPKMLSDSPHYTGTYRGVESYTELITCWHPSRKLQ